MVVRDKDKKVDLFNIMRSYFCTFIKRMWQNSLHASKSNLSKKVSNSEFEFVSSLNNAMKQLRNLSLYLSHLVFHFFWIRPTLCTWLYLLYLNFLCLEEDYQFLIHPDSPLKAYHIDYLLVACFPSYSICIFVNKCWIFL